MISAPPDVAASDTATGATVEFDVGGGDIRPSGAGLYIGVKLPMLLYQSALDLYATGPRAGACVYGAGVEVAIFAGAYAALTCTRGERFATLTGRVQAHLAGPEALMPDWAVGAQLAVGGHLWFFFLAYQHFPSIDVDSGDDSDQLTSQAIFVGVGLAGP